MSETDVHVAFAPPVADLTPAAADAPAVPFFLVGTRKLVVLTVVTFGIYQVYWFYMHWRRLQRLGQEDVWPIARAAFGGLFCYWLFQRVNEEADEQGVPTLLAPGLLTVLYFVGVTSSRFGAPWWLAIGLTVIPLALTQSIVNSLPAVQALRPAWRNERLSGKNWAGVAFFAFIVLLLLLPDPGPATAAAGAGPS